MNLNSLPVVNTPFMTLYCKYERLVDGYNRTAYNRYLITDGFYKRTTTAGISNNLAVAGEIVTALAPHNSDYMTPQDFWTYAKSVDPTEANTRFTVQAGDYIVMADIADEIPVNKTPVTYLMGLKNEDGTEKYPNIEVYSFVSKSAIANEYPQLMGYAHYKWQK